MLRLVVTVPLESRVYLFLYHQLADPEGKRGGGGGGGEITKNRVS